MAFDLDGTLLKKNQEIDGETLAFMKSLTDISYMLVTGRCFSLVEGILEQYQLDCDLILNSGHELREKNNREIFPFGKESGLKWTKKFLESGFHLSIHGGDGMKYIFSDLESYYQQHLEMSAQVRKKDISHLKKYPLFSREGYLKDTVVLECASQLEEIDILKLDARHMDGQIYEKMLRDVQEDQSLDYSAYWSAYVDICDNSMNKGKLLLDYAEKRGISPHEIAVFGDSDNDIQMLELIPHSFAMGNGKESVKKSARYVTDSHEEQGVLTGMRKILEQENNILM